MTLEKCDEKRGEAVDSPTLVEAGYAEELVGNNDFEVFKKTKDGVDFRTVGWPRASIIFLKGRWTFRIRYLLHVIDPTF